MLQNTEYKIYLYKFKEEGKLMTVHAHCLYSLYICKIDGTGHMIKMWSADMGTPSSVLQIPSENRDVLFCPP